MSRRVLLTGANGYIAQHILSVFLEAGHSVRGVVRSQAKVTQLESIFPNYVANKQLDFGVVPDITIPGAFDAVLKSDPSFEIVLHSASPFNYRKNTSSLAFLDPAIKGTTEILKSVTAHATSVKRVVLTGSIAAIADFAAPKVTTPQKIYTEADWNPVTWEEALITSIMNVTYQASKKFAEKAAWAFMEQKPHFDLVVLNPPVVLGPLVSTLPFDTPQELPESVFAVYNNILRPGLTSASELPPTRLHVYVDVRDLARAHLLGATVPAAGGHRFVICGQQGHMSNQRLANELRKALPELTGRIPIGDPEKELMPEGTYDYSSQLAKNILGLAFVTPEQTIADLAPQLLEVEKKAGNQN